MSEQSQQSERYDLVIVGSGPTGAGFAREYLTHRPGDRVLMVERGPQTTAIPGQNIRNLEGEERERGQRLAQGPNVTGTSMVSDHREKHPTARPGTFLITDTVPGSARSGDDVQTDMPGALASAGVGGMGQHWTGACPTPGNTERPPMIDSDELDELLRRSAEFLHVTQDAYPETPVRAAVERELGAFFNEGRPADRRVQAMPLAATADPDGGLPHWSGTDTVLGDLARPETRPDNFVLRPSTIGRRVLRDEHGAVSGVLLHDREGDRDYEVHAPAVVVASDAFGTPQVLWASGIRPRALGHYLNDQPQVMCAVFLKPEIAKAMDKMKVVNEREATTGVSWIPFWAPEYPYHGQIMQRDAAPMLVGEQETDERRPVVGLGAFITKDLQFDDYVEFDDDVQDYWGMPAPRIHYRMNETDYATVERATGIINRLVEHMGTPTENGGPRLVPAGSSIHYQGTVRMGATDDGESVCSPDSEVWGVPNLYVAGNGVIPTATASNPTVLSVAIAVKAARAAARAADARAAGAK